ncbi:hypothetical protein N7481_000386 [Penicillium waksmanii]|uniref:uncharacterized protein n=1 Tax=Penicillium waksmanii TaxID=69791 RepID=UPI002546EF45|nr:uncharacterized protein N7481_000386 [Penicillium waksmanii]KAJ5999977.1 hypothetical protein N7481_000386 [Penicillium waksmanii]
MLIGPSPFPNTVVRLHMRAAYVLRIGQGVPSKDTCTRCAKAEAPFHRKQGVLPDFILANLENVSPGHRLVCQAKAAAADEVSAKKKLDSASQAEVRAKRRSVDRVVKPNSNR